MITYASGDVLKLTREDVDAVIVSVPGDGTMDDDTSIRTLYGIPHRWQDTEGKDQTSRRYGALLTDYFWSIKDNAPEPGSIFPGTMLSDDLPDVILAVTRIDGPSKIEWIEKCLESIKVFCKGNGISRIAIPLIGSGTGQLSAKECGRLIVAAFRSEESMHVTLYLPVSMLARAR